MEKQYYETVDVRTGSLPLSPTDRTISEIVPVITNGDDCIQSAYYNFSFRHWANLSGELLDVTHWLRPVNLSNHDREAWVKVEDDLPKDKKPVIVAVKYGKKIVTYSELAYYYGSGWFDNSNDMKFVEGFVKSWQPLPSPPSQ